ncbi:MAG: PKD domain-containing protein [Bacteroidia bacterium]
MFRLVFVLTLVLSGLKSIAQTCSIVSSDIVCKEELMSFDVTASAGINSVLWDIGDASTSTQKSFSHKYSAKGVKNVKVTINLIGGGTCVASKQITVYELPVFKISLKPDNNYCLWKNNICLVDSSTGGDSAVKIKKRIVIWDDGKQDVTNNPPMGDIICHQYSNPGTYKVTVELTNDKDCKLEKTITVTILKDVVPDISVLSMDNEILKFCDSARTEFYDVTQDTSTITGRIYDWGDGSPKIATKSNHISHFYKKSGFYNVSLSVVQKNGCVTTKDTLIEVIVYGVKFDLNKTAAKICSGGVIRVTQKDPYSGAYYRWYLDEKVNPFKLQNPLPFNPQIDLKSWDYSPSLGKKIIWLEIVNHGCYRKSPKDSIEIVGMEPQVITMNDNQCTNRDTVYYKTKIKQYGMGKLYYAWDFGDDKAPQCTTSRVKGINIESNCNYATDSLGKHFYVNGICRTWSLNISDSASGCPSTQLGGIISVDRKDSVKFGYYADRLCIGNKNSYYVGFYHNLCGVSKIQTNLDSTCDKDRWSTKFISHYPYTSICGKDGWVTVGFAYTYGNAIVYTGFDSTDFYTDPSRVCRDTIWKHNWFRLGKDPTISFDPNLACINELTIPIIKDSVQKNIAFSVWSWGDNSNPDTFYMPNGDSLIPRPSHVYKRAGNYVMGYYLETKGRCFTQVYKKNIIGFHMQVDFDPFICPGSIVLLKDSMCYLDSSLTSPTAPFTASKNYWHIAPRKLAGKEEFKWDFDDGRGFVTDTANPVIKFPKIGFYNIRLAAKDSSNCWDTLTKLVNVGGVHAGIKNIFKRIICDGIVQLYDSSFSDYRPPLDSITKYYWEFGDGGNPSYVQNPFHYYSTFGNYTIFQRVENSRGCTDTAYINIVIEGPVANFDIVGDTVGCAPFTAEFDNKSIKTKDYIWYFGDPSNNKRSTNRDTNVRFTYTQPGTYYIYLFGSDSVINPNAGNAIYYCKTFFPDTSVLGHPVRRIVVLPAPNADFNVNFIQCKNKPIVVTANSDSLYTLHRWSIAGGDSLETTNKSGSLVSADTGTFVIKYAPWYQHTGAACLDTVSKPVRITQMNATFDIFNDSTSCPVYTFTNTSQGYKSIKWNLKDPGLDDSKNIRTENDFTYRYSQKGIFYPCLYAENNNGCLDTLCMEVKVDVIKKLIIPNVFTPGNNDKLNDAFDIDAEGLEEYHLVIYNRWGQKLFETDVDGKGDDGHNWRGRLNITSPIYPDGTYFYVFNYKFKCEDKNQQAKGVITLIGGRE